MKALIAGVLVMLAGVSRAGAEEVIVTTDTNGLRIGVLRQAIHRERGGAVGVAILRQRSNAEPVVMQVGATCPLTPSKTLPVTMENRGGLLKIIFDNDDSVDLDWAADGVRPFDAVGAALCFGVSIE